MGFSPDWSLSDAMTDELIALDSVSVRYRKRKSFFRHEYYEALRSVSFRVNKGDVLGVVGRNGCGKSTLLRLLSGIYHPDSGEIRKSPGLRVSLLSLQTGFDQQLSGIDNALFSAMLLGMKQKEAKSRLKDIIEFAELGEFADEPVKTYSTGMRARLGFAIAMQIEPDVLLIDETLGVGDAQFRLKAEQALRDALGGRQAVVLVSHMAQQISGLCNRAIWINDGTVKIDDSVSTVLSAYQSVNGSASKLKLAQ